MAKDKQKWVFTPKRKAALRKAQKRHAELVRLGKAAAARGDK